MKLTVVAATGCQGSTCPTIYRDEEDGSFVVQGYVLEACDDLKLPAGEEAVRIPASLVETLTRAVAG